MLNQVADAATCPVYELPAALLEEFCMDPRMIPQLYLYSDHLFPRAIYRCVMLHVSTGHVKVSCMMRGHTHTHTCSIQG